MNYKELKDLVYNYPTKYEFGFIRSEMEQLIVKLNLDHLKFNENLGINTCMMIDNEVITYHCDILLAVNLTIENRKAKGHEWD